MLLPRSTAFVLALLASALDHVDAQSNTYLVDDSGGAGVQFTDIDAAIAFAAPGDVLLLRAGTYPAFVLGEGLAILADPEVVVTGTSRVVNVPALECAVLRGMQLVDLEVTGCTGAAIFERCGVSPGSVRVNSCADVRLQGCTVRPGAGFVVASNGVSVTQARVELSACEVSGGKGSNWPNPRVGGDGLQLGAGARVHVALSNVKGGRGGNGDDSFSVNGARGGDGIDARSGAQVIVAGRPTNRISAGDFGAVQASPWSGGTAWGIWLSAGATLRHSGVAVIDAFGGSSNAFFPASASTPVVPPDPTLSVAGFDSAGAQGVITLFGVPGFNGRLQQGKQPLVLVDGPSAVELLVDRLAQYPLGPIPFPGSVDLTRTLPNAVQPGWVRWFQGFEIDPNSGATVQRTNSVVLIPR